MCRVGRQSVVRYPAMTPVLAQMFDGMEWIPLMVLSTGGGLVVGLLAILLRPFASARVAGRRLGVAAIVIGVVFTLFFVCVVGSEVFPVAYLIFASPALLGGVALVIYPRKYIERRGFPVEPASRDGPEVS